MADALRVALRPTDLEAVILLLYYAPIIGSGYENLTRFLVLMRHPRLTNLPPAIIIKMAPRAGLAPTSQKFKASYPTLDDRGISYIVGV